MGNLFTDFRPSIESILGISRPNGKKNRDEALVFKVYDSEKDGRARFTAHVSFEDPSTPPDAPPRESIEVRAIAFFEPISERELIVLTPDKGVIFGS